MNVDSILRPARSATAPFPKGKEGERGSREREREKEERETEKEREPCLQMNSITAEIRAANSLRR